MDRETMIGSAAVVHEVQETVMEPAQGDAFPGGMDPLTPETFRDFTSLIYRQAGIKLGPQKEALVGARLARRMRQLGVRSYSDYYTLVQNDASGREMVELLNCISTNVTSFFRDQHHFDFLAAVLQGWRKNGQNRFRLWSAACSTGEEPYSMALTVSEAFSPPYDVRILATDLSTKTLLRAKQASYEEQQVQGIRPDFLTRFFSRHNDGEKVVYQPVSAVRSLVTFGRLNLSEVPFPMRGPFDVIFCRHVMMYFDNQVRDRLLGEICRLLRPGGYLVVGRAESLCAAHHEGFKTAESSIYVKVG